MEGKAAPVVHKDYISMRKQVGSYQVDCETSMDSTPFPRQPQRRDDASHGWHTHAQALLGI
jgi:hypothetical protein